MDLHRMDARAAVLYWNQHRHIISRNSQNSGHSLCHVPFGFGKNNNVGPCCGSSERIFTRPELFLHSASLSPFSVTRETISVFLSGWHCLFQVVTYERSCRLQTLSIWLLLFSNMHLTFLLVSSWFNSSILFFFFFLITEYYSTEWL